MISSQEVDIIEISNPLDNHFSSQFDPLFVNEDGAEAVPPKPTSSLTSATSSLSSTANKRYCSKFKKEWLSNSKFSTFLRECKTDLTKVLCIVCNIQFSIQNSGLGDINRHFQTKKHQDCLKSAEANRCNICHYQFH
jgi:hypothetical protein